MDEVWALMDPYEYSGWMGPEQGCALSMDGSPWALGMDGPLEGMGPGYGWAPMGPRDGWVLGMDGSAWAVGMVQRLAGMGPGHRWTPWTLWMDVSWAGMGPRN